MDSYSNIYTSIPEVRIEIGKNLRKLLKEDKFNSFNEKWDDVVHLFEELLQSRIKGIEIDKYVSDGGDCVKITIRRLE